MILKYMKDMDEQQLVEAIATIQTKGVEPCLYKVKSSNKKPITIKESTKLIENNTDEDDDVEDPFDNSQSWETYDSENKEHNKKLNIRQYLNLCAKNSKNLYSSLALKAQAALKKEAKRVGHPLSQEEGQKVLEKFAKGVTNTFNPNFVGPTGAGKTSIINAWARDNGYEVVTISLFSDPVDLTGVVALSDEEISYTDAEGNQQVKKEKQAKNIGTTTFNGLRTLPQNKILFLDEINKADPSIVQQLFNIISFHTVQLGDDLIYLPGLLFCCAAMNPASYGNRYALDAALRARLIEVQVTYDTQETLKYLTQTFNDDIDAKATEMNRMLENDPESKNSKSYRALKRDINRDLGLIDISEKLLTNPSFEWFSNNDAIDDENNFNTMCPRVLEALLAWCNGTIAIRTKHGNPCLLELINQNYLNLPDEVNQMLLTCLKGYKDSDHKGNEVWNRIYDPDKQSNNTSARKTTVEETEDDEDEETTARRNRENQLAQEYDENTVSAGTEVGAALVNDVSSILLS